MRLTFIAGQWGVKADYRRRGACRTVPLHYEGITHAGRFN